MIITVGLRSKKDFPIKNNLNLKYNEKKSKKKLVSTVLKIFCVLRINKWDDFLFFFLYFVKSPKGKCKKKLRKQRCQMKERKAENIYVQYVFYLVGNE